jgi:hypothetical protein
MAGTHWIGALAVIETDRKVNERLQEEPARSVFRRPSFFQHFVALEELFNVE